MQEPQVLRLRKRPVDFTEYKKRMASEADVSRIVKEPCIIYDEDEQQATVVYLQLEDDTDDVVAALLRVAMVEDARTSGMASKARIFGYQGRSALRGRDFCNSATLAKEDPAAHETIMAYASRVARYYERFSPEVYAEHQRQVNKVLDEWKIEDSPFTSGIINRDNQLAYHFDAGNITNVWSNMLGFKRGIQGGTLAIPEYDLALEIADNTLTMFDGQGLLHGVTPFTKTRKDAYRFTVVYYALRSLWQCLPLDEEVARARQRRVAREEKRAGLVPQDA